MLPGPSTGPGLRSVFLNFFVELATTTIIIERNAFIIFHFRGILVLHQILVRSSSSRYVSQMNPTNKVFFDTRDEAVDAGYVPCKVCRP